ncbi:MAG: YhcH/YjgK/YiaL family protein, partial [Rickettsiales bacterium]|nr:YhcH/YjgK/YiaL family protein [Rickettsiales bacterium]
KLETGKKYPIDGDRVYAKIDEYNTFHSYEKNFEGHSRYADIQLMLSGDEIIEVKLKRGDEKEEVPYDEKKDMYKVKTYDSARILLRENEFAVFFPQDLHKPCISTSYRSEKVRKLVIKVLIDDKRK